MIPQGLAIAYGSNGVLSRATLTYKSLLKTIGLQSDCASDSDI